MYNFKITECFFFKWGQLGQMSCEYLCVGVNLFQKPVELRVGGVEILWFRSPRELVSL